jgi:hypothetical protein
VEYGVGIWSEGGIWLKEVGIGCKEVEYGVRVEYGVGIWLKEVGIGCKEVEYGVRVEYGVGIPHVLSRSLVSVCTCLFSHATGARKFSKMSEFRFSFHFRLCSPAHGSFLLSRSVDLDTFSLCPLLNFPTQLNEVQLRSLHVIGPAAQ